MKKILLIGLMAVAVISCKKDEKTTPAPTTTTTTNSAEGNWKITVYDGAPLNMPSEGTLVMTSTSATAGTAKFDITFNGTSHNIEEDTYALANSNTNISFTKTGGTYTVLSGGGNWTINTMSATALKMTSANGLIIECTK